MVVCSSLSTPSTVSLKRSVQEPLPGVILPEHPEALAGGRLDAVIVALDVRAAPPAGFDSLRSPTRFDDMLGRPPAKADRRPVRDHRSHLNRNRPRLDN